MKFTNLEYDLLHRINQAKSRGENISNFTEIQNKTFYRLLSFGLAEDVNGYAYVTSKGLNKLRKFK
jgi:hypothetical protein